MTVPGVGTQNKWQIIVGFQRSARSLDNTSYAAPILSRLMAGEHDVYYAFTNIDEPYYGMPTRSERQKTELAFEFRTPDSAGALVLLNNPVCGEC